MKKSIVIIFISLFFTGCLSHILTYAVIGGAVGGVSVPKYGLLPGVKCPIYDFYYKQYDICQYKFKLNLIDKRMNYLSLNCSETKPETDSEFEGANGYNFFLTYFITLVHNANGIIDSIRKSKDKSIDLEIEIISPKLIGFVYIKVHGLCQITAKTEFFTKTYCCDIEDGDETAPLEWYSIDTRKSALRKMTSAAIRDCIESLISDLESKLR
jgi:hypothetical protein